MKQIGKLLSAILLFAIFLPIALVQATAENNYSYPLYDSEYVISVPLAESLQGKPALLYSSSNMHGQGCARSVPDSFNANGFHYDFDTYVKTQGQVDVPAFSATSDFSASEVAEHINTVKQDFPLIEILGDPTSSYNCHSYAWFSSSVSNPYWINDVETYIDDVHTSRINHTMASVGDILVYFNKSGYQHSAVITDIDGDIYICESKWGASVLCRHPHNYVPSNYADDGMVNFYVFRIEEHNWTSYTNHQTGTHTRYCGSCDYFESTTCKITYVSSGSTGHYQHCALCGFRSSTSAHTRVTKYTGDGTTHTHGEVCSDCGYVYSSAGCTTVCRYSHTEGGVNYHHSFCTACGHETSAPSKCVYKGTSNACLVCQWPKGMTGETAEIEIPEEEVQLLDPEEELQLLAPDA